MELDCTVPVEKRKSTSSRDSKNPKKTKRNESELIPDVSDAKEVMKDIPKSSLDKKSIKESDKTSKRNTKEPDKQIESDKKQENKKSIQTGSLYIYCHRRRSKRIF